MDYCYRAYMADGIKACSADLADAFGGSELTERWSDIYKPREVKNAETIIKTISDKLDRMRSE